MTNAEARFNNSLRPRKPEGSLGRTVQDVHLDSHTAPELYGFVSAGVLMKKCFVWFFVVVVVVVVFSLVLVVFWGHGCVTLHVQFQTVRKILSIIHEV